MVGTSVVGPPRDEVPKDSSLRRLPWLGGRDLQKELGVTLHIGEDRIDLQALSLAGAPLISSSGGHPAVNVAEWPDEGYPHAQVTAQQYKTFIKWSVDVGDSFADPAEETNQKGDRENLLAGKFKNQPPGLTKTLQTV